MTALDILEILRRTETGEYCSVKDWDVRRIPGGVREKLKQHRLEKAFTPDDPVNRDDSLADAFYQAGYELALDLGMLCENTERIVSISKEELDDTLDALPGEIFVGEGEDGRLIRARKPEDPSLMIYGASMAITVSEEVWEPLTEAIAREPEVDILNGPSLIHVRGRRYGSATPFETYVGYYNGIKSREIRNRVGRPGMGGVGCQSAVTEYGHLGSYGLPGSYPPTDLAVCLFSSEMKIHYPVLHKVVHTLNNGGYVFAGSPAMIGGMPGPPEGAVLSAIACALLQYPILQAHIGGGEIYDVRHLTNVNRAGLWALSVTHQALSRNTRLLTHAIANEVSGPVTEALLLEGLAGVATIAVSGTAYGAGPRPAGGKLHDYLTPLECRFTAEVAHAASGMSRESVNEMVKSLLPRYEKCIKDPDVGKPLQLAYDIDTMTPSQEWLDIYHRVKAEAIGMGVPMREDQ